MDIPMMKIPMMVRRFHPNYNTPFGFIMPNGLNLGRSVHNPNSLLRRILKLLATRGDMTKADILITLGYPVGKTKKDSYGYVFKCDPHSYHANLFSAMVKGGFVRHYRKGRKVYWSIGERVSWPDKIIDV